jgi:hypothetical protein
MIEADEGRMARIGNIAPKALQDLIRAIRPSSNSIISN